MWTTSIKEWFCKLMDYFPLFSLSGWFSASLHFSPIASPLMMARSISAAHRRLLRAASPLPHLLGPESLLCIWRQCWECGEDVRRGASGPGEMGAVIQGSNSASSEKEEWALQNDLQHPSPVKKDSTRPLHAQLVPFCLDRSFSSHDHLVR